MAKISGEELLAKLNWRYAVKRFDPAKKIPDADWKVLEDSLILTPTSYGLQPYKFLVVQNPAIRKELRAVSWNQGQVEDCSHYLVLLGLRSMDEQYISNFIQRTADVRGTPLEKLEGYKNIMIGNIVKGPLAQRIPEWTARQTYIAFGNFMTSAAILDIDTCPLEGLDPLKYDEILGLTNSNYQTLAACAVGYRHAEDLYSQAKKVRFERKDLIEFR